MLTVRSKVAQRRHDPYSAKLESLCQRFQREKLEDTQLITSPAARENDEEVKPLRDMTAIVHSLPSRSDPQPSTDVFDDGDDIDALCLDF